MTRTNKEAKSGRIGLDLGPIMLRFREQNPGLPTRGLNFRHDAVKVEWVCEHGVGHTYWSYYGDYVHGCDGCCDRMKVWEA